MTLAIGVLFWVLILVALILWLSGRPPQPWPWPGLILFVCTILLGIAVFGGLHLVR
jgi:hypothetical protein